MKVLITGAAGFIGYHLIKRMASEGFDILGIDNINAYYDVSLKYGRLLETGINTDNIEGNKKLVSEKWNNYSFVKIDLTDYKALNHLFEEEKFTHVINLAAQAGVRYSIDAPFEYIQANIVGYMNILEACRIHGVKKLIYASSSSVYGMNKKVPFSEDDRTDTPVSLYAATKKCDEVLAYSYHKLYDISAIGLRFFTVYGPWGRPDMAPFKFMKAILGGNKISVYNHGNMKRDFTYIDDIIEGIVGVLKLIDNLPNQYRIYNIGCSNPMNLLNFINTIEETTGKKANLEMVGMQPGDVTETFADIRSLKNDSGYTPKVQLKEGIQRFYEWYIDFYGEQEKDNTNERI